MNKLVKTSALIGFILLYVFAVSATTYAIPNPTYGNTSNESGYFKDHSSHLFSHTNQSVENVYNFTSTNFPEPKKLAKAFLVVVQVTGTILESKFVQYSAGDTNFPLKFSKQDIIYPFHYFL